MRWQSSGSISWDMERITLSRMLYFYHKFVQVLHICERLHAESPPRSRSDAEEPSLALSAYITSYTPELSCHRLMQGLFMMPSDRKSPTCPVNTFQSTPSTRMQEKARSPCNKRIKKKTKEQLVNENFRRQNKSLAKKGNKLTKFEADVYILVRRKGNITIYTSLEDPRLEDPRWPLRPEDIVCCSLIPQLLG
jgi:hypothetical protein